MNTPTPISPQDVSSLIKKDIEACTSLKSILQQEQEALAERNLDTLGEIIEKKTTLLSHLENSAKKGAEWVRNTPRDNPEQLLGKWNTLLKKINQPELQDNWTHLKTLLKECKDLNMINGKVLSRSQQTNNRMGEILKGQTASPSLYNPKGASSNGNQSHRFGEA